MTCVVIDSSRGSRHGEGVHDTQITKEPHHAEHDPSGELRPRPADIQPGQGLQTYLSGIDATLAPYGGSFLIHGGSPQVVEGSLTCNLIVIGFPDADGAQHWYQSPAYQQLAVLRRTFAQGAVVLCRGEDADHRGLDILSRAEVAN